MERSSITPKVGELKYLLLNISILVRRLSRYAMAEKDVSEYVHSSTASSSFVAPKETACLCLQNDVLFDEITGKLLLSFSLYVCVYIRDVKNGLQYVCVCVCNQD